MKPNWIGILMFCIFLFAAMFFLVEELFPYRQSLKIKQKVTACTDSTYSVFTSTRNYSGYSSCVRFEQLQNTINQEKEKAKQIHEKLTIINSVTVVLPVSAVPEPR